MVHLFDTFMAGVCESSSDKRPFGDFSRSGMQKLTFDCRDLERQEEERRNDTNLPISRYWKLGAMQCEG